MRARRNVTIGGSAAPSVFPKVHAIRVVRLRGLDALRLVQQDKGDSEGLPLVFGDDGWILLDGRDVRLVREDTTLGGDVVVDVEWFDRPVAILPPLPAPRPIVIAAVTLNAYAQGWWVVGASAFNGAAYVYNGAPAAAIIDIGRHLRAISVVLQHRAGGLAAPSTVLYVFPITEDGSEFVGPATAVDWQARPTSFASLPAHLSVQAGEGLSAVHAAGPEHAHRRIGAPVPHRFALYHAAGGAVTTYTGRLEIVGWPAR